MTRAERRRRRIAKAVWRFNPVARSLAGIAPWWVVLETTGRRSGRPRQVPLARGPEDGASMWLVAVHGERSAFVRNIAADPRVRLKRRGTWEAGTASIHPLDPAVLRRFGAYARAGPRTLGIDARLVRVDLTGPSA